MSKKKYQDVNSCFFKALLNSWLMQSAESAYSCLKSSIHTILIWLRFRYGIIDAKLAISAMYMVFQNWHKGCDN